MSEIYKSDLGTVDNCLETVNTITDTVNNLMEEIDNFCEGSTNQLMGDGYDAVRNDIRLYSEDLLNINNVLKDIVKTSKDVNFNMKNYLTNAIDHVNDAYKKSLNDKLKYLKSRKANVQHILKDINKLDNLESFEHDLYTNLYANLYYYDSQIRELEKLIKIVNGLDAKDKSEYLKLSKFKVKGNLKHLNRFNYSSLFDGYDIDRLNWSGVNQFARVFDNLIELDLPQVRKDLVIEALSYLDHGIRYSRSWRRNMVDENGNPVYFDCSSYVSCVLRGVLPTIEEEGITSDAWTRTFEYSDIFHKIDYEELLPGDLLMETSASIHHIGMYIGKDENGNDLVIHMTSRVDEISVTDCFIWNLAIRYNNLS